jgi:hypothetical protein
MNLKSEKQIGITIAPNVRARAERESSDMTPPRNNNCREIHSATRD